MDVSISGGHCLWLFRRIFESGVGRVADKEDLCSGYHTNAAKAKIMPVSNAAGAHIPSHSAFPLLQLLQFSTIAAPDEADHQPSGQGKGAVELPGQ